MAVATSAAVVTPQGCSADLIRRVSACLSSISSRPYNLPSGLASPCCTLFTSAFHTGSATCLCRLFRQPSLVGFPLNTTHGLSISSVCPGAMNLPATISSKDFCEGSGFHTFDLIRYFKLSE
ncbi:Bifunctional inhibitor/plant lipid transfer protein/seed storage helical domain [Macleaya cordata]|uniref:Bifunctional inhibitor/plant lipid transfer protein/seed storage helical domain n=1 Tax=Macleaya cordata TaxID=56857 RepID=A0A200QLK1_MACCD|nr:Bifunctional inhibitor/plant lipid transfer protein/seed storage helical domain [Macleaya cordata]